MTDFLKVLQQAQQMSGKLQEMQDALGRLTVTGSAGGGMVTVETDGKGNVRRVSIEPSVVNPADVEMLEDLVAVAVQEAQKKAKELAEQEMKKAQADYRIIRYPAAKHSFTNPDADKVGMEAIAYNAPADKKSWADMQAFFKELFGPATPGK